MPNVNLQLYAVVRASESKDCHLGTLLLFPEVTACATSRPRILQELERGVLKVYPKLEGIERHRRIIAEPPTLHEMTMPLTRETKSPTWLTEIEPTFQYLVWQHSERRRVAYVPEFDLYVVPRVDRELESSLRQQIEMELRRRKATVSLATLLSTQRFAAVEVVPFAVGLKLPTPKQAYQAEREEQVESVLPKLAKRLRVMRPGVFELDRTAERIAVSLTAKRASSVLLVGPSGVGKSAAVQHVVANAEVLGLGKRSIWTTSGSKIVSGAIGFGMWEDRVRNLCAELKKSSAVLHIGDLFELVESGKGGASRQGLGEFLRPYLERSEILVIAECTPTTRAMIERENPGLLNVFTEIEIAEPDKETSLRILAKSFSQERDAARLDDAAIAETESLHRRFAAYSVSPGRPLRFLRNLVSDIDPEQPIGCREILAAFSRETGLPAMLLDDSVPLDLTEARGWFASRVIGQQAAVDVVIDLLATVKAGLNRPQRPLASLLFIGPTGVGKTEMAKTLAEYFYRDRNRMIRIDASEYADATAVQRLVGGCDGAEGVLTSKVRDQPFGVVLLDEFEKAHPLFFDMLLQVLGEGRLTDNRGNLADFRNTVLIMTSNLGAEAMRKGVVGFDRGDPPATQLRATYARHVQQFLRPEMFNRIDAIVPFDVLDKNSLLRITKRELRAASLRSGLRSRQIELEIPANVAAALSQHGFEPRYGARPLKRCIESELLLPLATSLNRISATDDVEVSVALHSVEQEGVRPELAVRVHRAPPQSQDARDDNGSSLAQRLVEFRRRVYRAEMSPALLGLKNEVYRLERAEEKYLKRVQHKKHAKFNQQVAAKIGVLRPLMERFRRAFDAVTELEESILLDCYANQGVSDDVQSERSELFAEELTEWRELALDLFERQFGKRGANRLLLAIYHEDGHGLDNVAELYAWIARSQNFRVRTWELRRCVGGVEHPLPPGCFRVGRIVDGKPRGTVLEAHVLNDNKPPKERHENAVGILLAIDGRLAFPFFSGENGLHRLKQSQGADLHWLIDTVDCEVSEYRPPDGVERRDPFRETRPRREYHDWIELDDEEFGGRVPFVKSPSKTLGRLLSERLVKQAEALLEP